MVERGGSGVCGRCRADKEVGMQKAHSGRFFPGWLLGIATGRCFLSGVSIALNDDGLGGLGACAVQARGGQRGNGLGLRSLKAAGKRNS